MRISMSGNSRIKVVVPAHCLTGGYWCIWGRKGRSVCVCQKMTEQSLPCSPQLGISKASAEQPGPPAHLQTLEGSAQTLAWGIPRPPLQSARFQNRASLESLIRLSSRIPDDFFQIVTPLLGLRMQVPRVREMACLARKIWESKGIRTSS